MDLAVMAAAAALFSFPGGQAVSSAPLLPAAALAAPRPRAGLWTLAREDCRFNLRSDLDRWPSCADPVQIGETALSRPDPGKAGIARRYRFAVGDPGFLQVETGEGGARAWSYYAFRPLATGPDGLAIRARVWPVPCPSKGCTVRNARDLVAAARGAEDRAFAGDSGASGRTAVWARRAQ